MALQVSLTIPPNHIMLVPTIPEDATEEQAAAIQQEINQATAHNMGDVYPQSYARIMYVRAMSQESFIFVNWYADQAARERGEQAVKIYEYQTDTTNLPGDVYPAAYAYLKTLPEFSGATDC